MKKSKVLARFKYPIQVEVRETEFEPLASIAALDLARLRTGNHRIEIGSVSTGCCQKLVYAIVNNGLLTGVEFGGSEDSNAATSKELLDLVKTARGKIRARAKWRPIPVDEFFRGPAQIRNTMRNSMGLDMYCIKWIWPSMICYVCGPGLGPKGKWGCIEGGPITTLPGYPL